ncbi:MAG: hypothetical protein NXH82_09790, partial [Rhodobacteraceae bacterium]|nr:hypothetical protein [Paracoccaceae bacterium]
MDDAGPIHAATMIDEGIHAFGIQIVAKAESVRSSVYLRFGPCFLRGARTMTISKELLDELLKGCERPEDLLGDFG